MNLSGPQKAELLRKIHIQSIFLGGFAIYYFAIGGVALGFINTEPIWYKDAWFQLHYGAYTAGTMFILTTLVYWCVISDASKKPNYDMKAGLKRIKTFVFFGFVSLLVCAVFCGYWTGESKVFSNCTTEDNITTLHENSTDCFKLYERIKGISAGDIIPLVISLLLILEELFSRQSKVKLLLSTFSSPTEAQKKDAIEGLAKKGWCLYTCALGFVVIGGLALDTYKKEGIDKEEIGLGMIIALFTSGIFTFLAGMLSMRLCNDAKTKSLGVISKFVQKFFCLLILTTLALVVNISYLVRFTNVHADVVRCWSGGVKSGKNVTNDFICLENKDSLNTASILCCSSFPFCFIFIFLVHTFFVNILKEYTKVEDKKPTTVKNSTPKLTTSTANASNLKTKNAGEDNNPVESTRAKNAGKIIVPQKQNEHPGPTGDIQNTNNWNNTNVSAATVYAQLEQQTMDTRTGTTCSLDFLERQNRLLLEHNQLLMQQLVHAAGGQQLNTQRDALYRDFVPGCSEFPRAPQPVAVRNGQEHIERAGNNQSTPTGVKGSNVQLPFYSGDEMNQSKPPSYDDLFCVTVKSTKE